MNICIGSKHMHRSPDPNANVYPFIPCTVILIFTNLICLKASAEKHEYAS